MAHYQITLDSRLERQTTADSRYPFVLVEALVVNIREAVSSGPKRDTIRKHTFS